MRKRTVTLIVGVITMASAVGLGQVIIRGTEISGQAPGNSASISAVHINTLDRDIVPLIERRQGYESQREHPRIAIDYQGALE